MNRAQRPEMAPIAQLLCSIVKARPGIHFRGLARAANVSSTGQLRHHLDRLGRRGALVEVEDGRFKRFFVPGDHDARVRHGLARFARPVPRAIGGLLLQRAMKRTELRRSLGCADSTLGYHLSRMVGTGDVIRTPNLTYCLYSLADPGFVGALLDRRAEAGDRAAEHSALSTIASALSSVDEVAVDVAPDGNAHGPVERPANPPEPPRPGTPSKPLEPDAIASSDPSAAT